MDLDAAENVGDTANRTDCMTSQKVWIPFLRLWVTSHQMTMGSKLESANDILIQKRLESVKKMTTLLMSYV